MSKRILRRSMEAFERLYKNIEQEIEKGETVNPQEVRWEYRVPFDIKKCLHRDLNAATVGLLDPNELTRKKAEWAYPRAKELLERLEKLSDNK